MASRHLRRTKNFPKVEQFHPAPIAETPFWFCEVGHFRLCIQVRPSGAYHPLVESEAFTPHCKFRGEICRHWHHSLGAESQRLPIKIAQIQGMLVCPASVQRETHLAAFHRQRHFHFVIENPPVFDFHSPYMQVEKRFAQRLL